VEIVALFHTSVGPEITSLAIIPVIAGSWYFGVGGGVLTMIFSILANIFLRMTSGHSYIASLTSPSTVVGTFALIFVALVVGRLGTITRERREVIARLEKLEQERRNYTNFLESLNEITRIALEASDLGSALKVLVERIGKLFGADDCFFAFWDEENKVTTPMVAYGSMSETYPKMRFESGEQNLSAVVMQAERPFIIEDLQTFTDISPQMRAVYPSRSVLGMPLIVEGNKIAAFALGYNNTRQFDQTEITNARTASQAVALVLTKIQLLEDAQKQVKQLTTLHEVALVSTQVGTIDELIEQITEIIGRNLFPDNFGILLMDEKKGVLQPHPSYRFVASTDSYPAEIHLGEGVTGQVAETGQPIRIGNVKSLNNYLDVDQTTSSELCVPIKLKGRILGVINTESTRPEAFSLDDELLLGTLAGQLATAIEQLRTAESERQWLDQLAHSNDLIYSLAHITTHIEKAFSAEQIIQTLGVELNKIGLTCLMAVYDKGRGLFTVNYTSMEPEFLEIVEDGLGHPLIKYTFSRDRLNTGNILYPSALSNPEEEIEKLFARTRRQGVMEILQRIGVGPETQPLRLPLVFEENLLGVLWIWGKGLTKTDLPIMSIFAKQIGVSLERARLFQEVQSLALTDPLTGLQNRRSLFELGRIEFSRAHRMERPFCCMMLDLDHFKQINDKYGHPVGDQVLQEFANCCKRSVREVDLIGRYGGEELVILLPETDLKTALPVAERLRARIAGTPILVASDEIYVTASIGLAAKDEYTQHLDTLIARADQAMYIAKHRGRDCVAVSK